MIYSDPFVNLIFHSIFKLNYLYFNYDNIKLVRIFWNKRYNFYNISFNFINPFNRTRIKS